MNIDNLKFPKSEKVVLSFFVEEKLKYLITKDIYSESCYYRYDVVKDKLLKRKDKKRTPIELYD